MNQVAEEGKVAAGPREYLTFRLDQEEYGIDTVSYTHLTLPTKA